MVRSQPDADRLRVRTVLFLLRSSHGSTLYAHRVHNSRGENPSRPLDMYAPWAHNNSRVERAMDATTPNKDNCLHGQTIGWGKDRAGNARRRFKDCGKVLSIVAPRPLGRMRISLEDATLILSLLNEGSSIRSAERISGVHRDTICKLLRLAGEKCEAHLSKLVREVPVSDGQRGDAEEAEGDHRSRAGRRLYLRRHGAHLESGPRVAPGPSYRRGHQRLHGEACQRRPARRGSRALPAQHRWIPAVPRRCRGAPGRTGRLRAAREDLQQRDSGQRAPVLTGADNIG